RIAVGVGLLLDREKRHRHPLPEERLERPLLVDLVVDVAGLDRKRRLALRGGLVPARPQLDRDGAVRPHLILQRVLDELAPRPVGLAQIDLVQVEGKREELDAAVGDQRERAPACRVRPLGFGLPLCRGYFRARSDGGANAGWPRLPGGPDRRSGRDSYSLWPRLHRADPAAPSRYYLHGAGRHALPGRAATDPADAHAGAADRRRVALRLARLEHPRLRAEARPAPPPCR